MNIVNVLICKIFNLINTNQTFFSSELIFLNHNIARVYLCCSYTHKNAQTWKLDKVEKPNWAFSYKLFVSLSVPPPKMKF